jgi:N-methylhydantoinase B/oxoprolinase/acetone carboxylase alpha subunit
MTQRLDRVPFELNGGQSEAKGENIRVLKTGVRSPRPHAAAYRAEAGEGLIIETPGGGGAQAP